MNIGIIGAGDIGQTLGQAWAKAGHNVMLSSRHPEQIRKSAQHLGVSSGSTAEAAKHGDVILLAVNYVTVDAALESIGPYVNRKLVIDATNPLHVTDDGSIERVIENGLIAGEVMQSRLPTSRIGKAFTTLWSGHLQEKAFATPRIAMTLAADLASDRETIGSLVTDVGFAPVDLGTLSDSRPLDPPSPIWNVVLQESELRDRVSEFRDS